MEIENSTTIANARLNTQSLRTYNATSELAQTLERNATIMACARSARELIIARVALGMMVSFAKNVLLNTS